MPRPLREDHEGAWHHVLNRGAARRVIYTSEADRSLFLECLAQAAQEADVEVHAYCLMSNHFHILVCSRSGRLSQFLKLLSGRYTRLFNLAHDRDGPLFRGRATTVGITTDAQLLQTLRYVHANPVSAGLVAQAELWRWSSAASYLVAAERPDWLRTQDLRQMFEGLSPGADMGTFHREGIDATTTEFYAGIAAVSDPPGQTPSPNSIQCPGQKPMMSQVSDPEGQTPTPPPSPP